MTGVFLEALRARAADPNDVFAHFTDGTTLTAQELSRDVDRAAGALRALGMRSGRRLMLLGVTSAPFLAAIAGGWLSGALIAPLEAFLARDGMRKVVRLFKPDLVVVDPVVASAEALLSICAEDNIPSVNLSELSGRTEVSPLPIPEPNVPALSIFTSGSTGVPKGVVLSHQNLAQGAENVIRAKMLTSADRAFCVLPMSHLNGMVTTYVTPMISGGRVVYWQGSFNPSEALRQIDKYACTWVSAVPTHYTQLMNPPIAASDWSLRSVRFFRSAAAPLPVAIRKEFESHYGVTIVETMGMTETSGQIFCNPLPPEVPREGSVGRPVGFDIRLVTTDGQLVNPGEVGEIQIRGNGVMLGYLDSPEETEKAFDGEWLRSGDLASRDNDNFYYIRGRIKDIAIFSGINISLRAIESHIQEARIVEDIACVGVPDKFFGEKVIAYIIPRGGNPDLEGQVDTVAEMLRAVLPSPQALSEVRVVESFPRSGAGKVLKGRLSEVTVLLKKDRSLPRDAEGLIREVLHIPSERIDDTLGLGRVRQWDSLGHVALVLAVETLLERRLIPKEIVALTKLPGLRAVLAGNLDDIELAQDAIDGRDGEIDNEATRGEAQLVALMRWNGLLPDSATANVDGATTPDGILTFQRFKDSLHEAGLRHGDTVLLHADVSALGMTEAGLDREEILKFYFQAFRDVLGDSGTLCMCTSFEDYGRYATPFVRETSPSRLGAFSEFLRTQEGTIRSLHPIVSVSANGGKAKEISSGAHFEGFGYDSPWGRLHRFDAKLMTLGMGHYPEMGMTFLHYIERMYGVPYQYTKIYDTPVMSGGENCRGPFTMSVRYLDFGISYDTNRYKNDLVAAGIGKTLPVGRNSLFVAGAKDAFDLGIDKLNADRYYFLTEPPRFRPGVIPADGQTGDIQYSYDRTS